MNYIDIYNLPQSTRKEKIEKAIAINIWLEEKPKVYVKRLAEGKDLISRLGCLWRILVTFSPSIVMALLSLIIPSSGLFYLSCIWAITQAITLLGVLAYAWYLGSISVLWKVRNEILKELDIDQEGNVDIKLILANQLD